MRLVIEISDLQTCLMSLMQQLDGEPKEENLSTILLPGIQSFKYTFENPCMFGMLEIFHLGEETYLTKWDFEILKPIEIIRAANQEDKTILFTFISSDALNVKFDHPKEVQATEYNIDQEPLLGMNLSSSAIQMSSQFFPGNRVKMVNLRLPQTWLQNNINFKENAKWDFIFSGEPVTINNLMDGDIRESFEKIFNVPYIEEVYPTMHKGLCFEILGKYLSFIDRFTGEEELGMSMKDALAIALVEKQISEQAEKTIFIPEIAEKLGMSVSKFATSFKKLYKMAPYDYYQSKRLSLARQLIISRQMTVSEAGRHIGYKNLSHFSKAFTKQFGYLPSELK